MLLDPTLYRMDELLRRPYTPTTPFGASGDCVWATSPQGWGFAHGVHWVHTSPKPEGLAPFTLGVLADDRAVAPAAALYRPSHVTLHGRDDESGLQITEDKFITQDDVVVSVVSLRNPSDGGVHVRLNLGWGVAEGENFFREGVPVFVHRQGPPGDDLRQMLPPGGRRTLVFAVAFAPTAAEALRRAARWTEASDPVRTQADTYQRWFDDNIPRFDCSDPWLTKLWYHRWYVVKKNHMHPGAGLTREDSFAEGRWNSGWYSATITYGAGHVLRETRWLRDGKYARNYFRGFARSQRADGLYRSFYVDGIARPDGDEGKYTDWITAAVWDTHLVHPDRAFLAEALPALKKNVAYWQSHASDSDGLLIVDDHWWTGMEWQPSFFYRADYRLGARRDGRDVQNPVQRLDLTAYQYGNVRALEAVCRTLGDENAARAAASLADTIRDAVLTRMWDAASGFFYDLLPETDEKIFSAKTIAAFYPFYTGLPEPEQARAWAHLLDPDEFWTPHPAASTARDSPAYAQAMEMRGHPLTGCYWNGPTWPHANSLVASGLADSLRRLGEDAHPPGARRALFDLVCSFGRAQFENGDFARPHTGEFYSGLDARWLTAQRDYHHSTWADLIITGLVGLVPRDDDVLEVHPLLPPASEGGWSHFCLEDVPYRGRLLTLVWDDPAQPGDAYEDGDKGFTITVDGRRVHHQNDLSPFAVPLDAADAPR